MMPLVSRVMYCFSFKELINIFVPSLCNAVILICLRYSILSSVQYGMKLVSITFLAVDFDLSVDSCQMQCISV